MDKRAFVRRRNGTARVIDLPGLYPCVTAQASIVIHYAKLFFQSAVSTGEGRKNSSLSFFGIRVHALRMPLLFVFEERRNSK